MDQLTGRLGKGYFIALAAGRLTAQSLGLPVRIYDPTLHYDTVRNQLWGTTPDD